MVADMQVAWEALLAQARANCDQAHANRVIADALPFAMRVDSHGNAVGESEVIDVPGFGDVVLGGGRELPHAPVRSNGAEDWEVIEDCFLDIDDDGPHTPPRRLGFGGCTLSLDQQ